LTLPFTLIEGVPQVVKRRADPPMVNDVAKYERRIQGISWTSLRAACQQPHHTRIGALWPLSDKIAQNVGDGKEAGNIVGKPLISRPAKRLPVL